MKAKIENGCIVSDYVARQVLEMAREFYSHPENVKKYQQWHLKTYGCLPQSFPNTSKPHVAAEGKGRINSESGTSWQR